MISIYPRKRKIIKVSSFLIKNQKIVNIFFLSFVFFSFIGNSQDLGNLKNQKPFTIRGSLGTSASVYSQSGTNPNSSPFSWMVTGNFQANIYGVDLPFSFVYSERDRNYRQPFNQFGLSPHYKWFTAHLGYRNLNFSSYTLAGYSILGAGFEMNPGKLRVGFIYGRFNRETGYPGNGINPTPAYKRNGFSFKAGYGTKTNFFDLIFLKAQDDSTSLKRDSNFTGLNPASNVVIGYNSKFTIAKGFTFESEGALSVYTENVRNDSASETVNNMVKSFKGVVPVNITSEDNTAVRVALGYKIKNYSLKLQYRRIAPNFKSMGAYFINNDFQNITLEPGVKFPQKKLNIRGSIGLQQDNLSKNKKTTSARTIGSAGLSWNPGKFGLDINYSTLTTSQKAGNIPLVDTSKVFQSNQSLTFTPRYMFASAKNNNSITLVYSYLVMNDHNDKTADFTEFMVNNAILSYTIAEKEGKYAVNAGVNYSGFTRKNTSTNLYGFSAGYTKSLLKKMLTLTVPLSVMKSDIPGAGSVILNFFPTANMQIKNKHNFSLQASYIANYADAGSTGSYHEIKAEIGYIYNF